MMRIDSLLGGLARSIGMLFSANVVVALLGLVTMALTAQALGPAGVGLLALIEAYARSVDQVCRFEPSQALIRYGTAAREDGREADFLQLVKFSTLIDIGGAALAALIALAGLGLAGDWFGFTEEERGYASLFALTLFFAVSATPIALLRLLSRFKLYAKMLVAVALLRLALVAAAWQSGADVELFVAILVASALLEHLVPVFLAWRLLLRSTDAPVLRAPLKGVLAGNEGIIGFIFNSNINVLARNSTRQFDVVLLGGLVSTEQIGLYQIAKRCGLAALRFARPVQFVVYPTLSKLWHAGEAMRMARLVVILNGATLPVGALAVAAVWLYGEELLASVFGAEFAAGDDLLLVHVMAVAVFLAGTCLNAALLSVGAHRALARITVVAALVFFAAFVPVATAWGTLGASALHLAFNLVWTFGCSIVLWRAVVGARQRLQ